MREESKAQLAGKESLSRVGEEITWGGSHGGFTPPRNHISEVFRAVLRCNNVMMQSFIRVGFTQSEYMKLCFEMPGVCA